MSYLGRKGAVAPLTSGDIPDGVIEGRDIAFFENGSTTQNLSGTYSTERMYLNDSYTLTGDVTITGHLALGTVADSDVVITDDGSTRTITGSGTLETGELMPKRRETLTGMTGELGTGVTLGSAISYTGSPNLNLGNATFPAGHVLQVKEFPYTSHMSIPGGGRGNAESIPFEGSDSGNSYGCPITMSNTNNKVGVFLTVYSGNVNESANHQYELMYNTSVGGTWVQSAVNGGANYWALVEHNTYTGIIYQTQCHSLNHIFVPTYVSGTTVWVKQQVWENTGATSYINRSGSGSNYVKGTSMILMEIQA